MIHIRRSVTIAVLLCLVQASHLPASGPVHSGDRLRSLLQQIPPDRISTGILYDRVLPLSGIERFTGEADSPPLALDRWKQIYFELCNASAGRPTWPGLGQFLRDARKETRAGAIPVAFLQVRYDRIRADALDTGALQRRDGALVIGAADPFEQRRVVAAAPLDELTWRGATVTFAFDERWYVTNENGRPRGLKIDFGDGRGYRDVAFGDCVTVGYGSTGRKTVRISIPLDTDETLSAAFYFNVSALQTPLPNDTLPVTAGIPYDGVSGSGEAYVYLADPLGTIVNPVIVVEGFDLDNTMNWDELYALLNQEGLLENLRSQGFDAVVLNFTEATDYIQRNAYVLVSLIQNVMDALPPEASCAVIGASMGGLVARYALAWMEQNGMDHRARTFISFDAPHNGANIPLGVQYWMDFFADQSADAAFLLSRLDTPAARQMLVYHHTTPPGATGEADPLRPAFLADLASAGSWPDDCRRIAVANGSGYQAGQGFAAGEQIVLYEYSSFLVDIIGNVWAVADGGPQTIFHGLTDIILLPSDEMTVSVTGTMPYDNAPGGYRSSMAQMDSSEAPYGDIIALYDNHCFIPTVSALALDTQDLFLDIANQAGLLSMTPFDRVYYPAANQEHVTITAESAEWFIGEIRYGATGTGDEPPAVPAAVELYQNYPNPFNPVTTIRFAAGAGVPVTVSVFDVKGRRLIDLFSGPASGAMQSVSWDGADRFGNRAGSGVYWCRLSADGQVRSRKIVLVK